MRAYLGYSRVNYNVESGPKDHPYLGIADRTSMRVIRNYYYDRYTPQLDSGEP